MTGGAGTFGLGVPHSVAELTQEGELAGLVVDSELGQLEVQINAGLLGAIQAKGAGVRIGWAESDAALDAWGWKGGGRLFVCVRKGRVLAFPALGTNYDYGEFEGHK